MRKYIIKNCPAIYGNEYCKENTYEDGSIHCQDCNDCVMKQVVELCKEIISRNGNINFKEGFSNLAVGENFVARQILKLLDTQEVE